MPDENMTHVEQVERPITAPSQFPVAAQGFANLDHATRLATLAGEFVREISRNIDLSQLDGVTLAFDYQQALLNLDRGYESTHKLTPSDHVVVGVAMTPSVLREGAVKSHIVLNANHIVPLENPDDEFFARAVHILAHECAHVEVTHRFNTAFPGVLLQRIAPNLLQAYRSQVISSCWDEYAATFLSAGYGEDQSSAYEDTFLQFLQETRDRANAFIVAYRSHENHGEVLGEVFGAYGALMKYASYHLGNLAGWGRTIADMPRTVSAMEGHWFAPYFNRLQSVLSALMDNHGKWADSTDFELLGDLAQEVVAFGGVEVTETDAGGCRINVPYTRETMPRRE